MVTPPTERPSPIPPSTVLIGVLALLTAVPPLATDMYLPGFPAMARELGTTASSIQLTLTAFLIGMALGQLVIGPLSDQWGRRMPMIAGSAVCLAAGVGAALAPSIELLVGARFLQGFAGAAGVVLARAIVADRTRGPRAAQLFGILMIIGGIAPVVAPLLGGLAVDTVGWRGIFWILAGLTALMLAAAIFFVPESLPPENRHAGGLRSLLASIGSVARNRTYMGYTLTFGFAFTAFFAYISASPFVLQNMFGLSAASYSVVFAVNSLGLMVTSALAAKLAHRFTLRGMLAVGVGALTASTAFLLFSVLVGAGLWPTLVLLFLTVLSLGFIFANAATLATTQVPQSAGTASALLGAIQFGLAAVISPIVGLGGEDTALPMAIAMFVAALVAAVTMYAMTTRDSDLTGTRSTGAATPDTVH
ncbi:multidrug effflux MFS transporter [Rhodococcus sp. NPDC058639]|uniref:multidrug effflux MFS transporter n=1 Tax=Rhodococcus sp. NPDC058639 TaxID=3346570 RepID=UPI003655987D